MREKLELILAGVEGRICNGCGNFDIEDSYEVILDHLIANGVTVREKGEWNCLEAEIGYYACTLCDHRILRAKCNFCPNCGARMTKDGDT